MDYKVKKPFGAYQVGNVVTDDTVYIRRKLKEDPDCLSPHRKMDKTENKNKMDNYSMNKGGK